MTDSAAPVQDHLGALLTQQFGELAQQVRESVAWWGAQIENTPSASVIIASFGRELTDEEKREALKFYDGDQWPEDVRFYRCGHPPLNGNQAIPSRPVLTVNRLPEIAAAAIEKDFGSFLPGEILPADVVQSIESVKAIIAIQNADAQRLYNYTLSAYAEMLSIR